MKRKKGNEGYVAIKLDMSKVYDWVEWFFLWDMMQRLSFEWRWIDLMKNCVTSLKY